MTKERKRGGPFPSGRVQKEAQELGPYPTWDAWKHTLVERFPEALTNSNEPLLKEFYIVRRKAQQKQIETGKAIDHTLFREFNELVEKTDPDFKVRCAEIRKFIAEKTSVPTNKRGRR